MLPGDNQQEDRPPVDLEALSKQRLKALASFIEKITPWLLSFGNWIFGGLIAFNLLIVASLITVGPTHLEILVAMAAFACALPLNVTGLFLLKLTKDMKDVAFNDLMREAFKDANFPDIDIYFPASQEPATPAKKPTNVALGYSLGIAVLGMLITAVGMVATLWYMAWWVAVIFLTVIILSFALLIFVFSRSMPPESEAEKELRKRYLGQRNKQGKGQRK